VQHKKLAELKQLDAGYRYTEGDAHPYRGRGIRVPTLEEVYEEFPGIAVNIEIKKNSGGTEEAVLSVIRKAGAEERTLAAAGRHSVIRRFRDVSGGGIATSASGLEVWLFFILSVLHLEHFARPRYQALQVPVTYGVLEVVSDRFLNAAHRMGVRVDAWTVNEPKEMDRLSEKGVDVVMTNRPGVLHRVLERRRGA
jgi:glycerophosphoryl diester phosphodiesterase